MASFVASSYARVPGGSTKGFPSWSEESITGTYYTSFVVSKNTASTSYSYPALIGKDVQIVTYPVNWSSGSEHSKIFSTPHAAGFDSAKGNVYVERSSDDLTLQCDTAVVLFSSGKQADSTGEYGIKITNGNDVSVIERSFSNLVIEEVISVSADSAAYRGSSSSQSFGDDTYRLYDLPVWHRMSNDKIRVQFTKQYVRPPVLAVRSVGLWAFITMHTDSSTGRCTGATFYIPSGVQSYPNDFKVAVLGPLDTSYKQAVYNSSRYTSTYGSATATHNVLTTTAESYKRPGVLVQTEDGSTIFSSRYAPAGDLVYAGDVLTGGLEQELEYISYKPMAIGSPLSVPSVPGESINQSVSAPYIIASGYHSLGYEEATKQWQKKKKKLGVTYKRTYYSAGGVSSQVVCLGSVAGDDHQIAVHRHTYYNKADRKSKTVKYFDVWLNDFLNFIGGLFDVSFGSKFKSYTRTTSGILNRPGVTMSNLGVSGLPKVYTIQLKLPLMGVTNIVSYGTVSAEDIPPPASTGTIAIPDIGDPVVLDPEEVNDVDEASIYDMAFSWIRFITPLTQDRIDEIHDEILAWCVANNIIPNVDPVDRYELFDKLDVSIRKEVMLTASSVFHGLSYVYYYYENDYHEDWVRADLTPTMVSGYTSGYTDGWGIILDSHGGTRAMMRSVFYTVSDFLHYYCSLMYQTVEEVEPENEDEENEEVDPAEPEFATVNHFLNFNEGTQRQITATDSRVVKFWEQIYAQVRSGPMSALDGVGSNERKQVFDTMLSIACSTKLPLASAGVTTATRWYPIHINPETVYGVSDSPYFSYYTGDSIKPFTYCWELSEDQQGKVPVEDPELNIELTPEHDGDEVPED